MLRARLPGTIRSRAVALLAAALCAATGLPAVGTTTTTAHGAPTVVAVVEPGGFSPYHYDFAGHQHPWAGTPDQIDFTADPATYISGYPTGANAVNITVPTSPTDSVSALHTADAAAWGTFVQSTSSSIALNWFPGTKVVGAVAYGSSFFASNDAHGTRSAASAVGNIHGTCPECLVVLVAGTSALSWAQSQPWIDVVTNSWGSSRIYARVGDVPNVGEVRVDPEIQPGISSSLAAADRGQSIVFSSANGVLNTGLDVPQFTYLSGNSGPDWVITVSGVRGGTPTPGYGKPADVAAQSFSYPSAGGDAANGTGSHSGTSNAAPMVAGALAKIVQYARDELGDTTGGQSGGVVASGTPVACGSADPGCPLDDGELTRVEAERLLFRNVTPLPVNPGNPRVAAPPHLYLAIGHGIVRGVDAPAEMAAQQARFHDALLGTVAPLTRPVGERAWMIADSQCRQRIWGAAAGGYWTGSEADDGSSPFATAWRAWCTPEVAQAIRDGIGQLPFITR